LLFIDAKYGEWNGTAVKQIAAKGVPLDKIVVGKPVTPADASNTGYVPAADLHEWAARAAVEIGWNTGLMDWQYSSD
jgi:chitinase